MVAVEARPQVTFAVRDACRLDALDPDRFDEHVRRDEHETRHGWPLPAWMIAIEAPSLWPTRSGRSMPSSASNAGSTMSASSCMYVSGQRFGGRIRSAVAVPGVGDRRHAAERGPHVVDEAPPQLERAEPFVQEHHRWSQRRDRPRDTDMEPAMPRR